MRERVQVGQDEETGGERDGEGGREGVGVEVVEEGFGCCVGFGEDEFVGVVFGHFGVEEAFEVWPAGLQDEGVAVDYGAGVFFGGSSVVVTRSVIWEAERAEREVVLGVSSMGSSSCESSSSSSSSSGGSKSVMI